MRVQWVLKRGCVLVVRVRLCLRLRLSWVVFLFVRLSLSRRLARGVPNNLWQPRRASRPALSGSRDQGRIGVQDGVSPCAVCGNGRTAACGIGTPELGIVACGACVRHKYADLGPASNIF